jgi:hypothetical protein
VHCELQYEPSDHLRSLDRWHRWWFPDRGEPFDVFVSAVEARPEFVALADVAPLSRRVSRDMV